jgi:hypothetical protein
VVSDVKVSRGAQGKLKSATLTAVVTRADGTVEDLGVLCHYERPNGLRGVWHDFKADYRRILDERS